MDDVAVGELHVADVLLQLGADLVSLAPATSFHSTHCLATICPVAPWFLSDLITIRVIERANEALLDGHIATIADIDSIRIGAVAEQLGVLHRHPVGLVDGDRPVLESRRMTPSMVMSRPRTCSMFCAWVVQPVASMMPRPRNVMFLPRSSKVGANLRRPEYSLIRTSHPA